MSRPTAATLPFPSTSIGELSALERLRAESQGDGRMLRRALGAAAVLHCALFLLELPAASPRVTLEAPERPVAAVLTEVTFVEPEPPIAPVAAPIERQAPRVPVPEPEPTAPEPVREFVPTVVPVLDILPLEVGLEIPAAPPPVSTAPRVVAGEVMAPVRAWDPAPNYPEPARIARREGLAIVQAIIDTEGLVTDVRVLRDPGMGLGNAAARAIRSWRFEPATFRGEPVAVYYNLTVNFTIQ